MKTTGLTKEKIRMIKCFKLYKQTASDLNRLIAGRKVGRFGIAVGKDEYAVKWQEKEMRLEILEAFLEGRNPNWHFARYLSYEEREKRNKSYLINQSGETL